MTTDLTGLILIVDDIPSNLDVISEALGTVGFDVAIATSGERALQHLKRQSPDLILLDVMMPGMDGFETCQRLKANPKTCHIPIIFMTAVADADSKVKGFELGAVDYITKPFQEQEVLARLRTHLKLKKLSQVLEIRNAELQQLTEQLEQLVSDRTQELSQALTNLKAAQAELVAAEKMAALGGLVAGIAHEINTPIGIGVTAASLIVDKTEEMTQAIQNGMLKRSELDKFMDNLKQSSTIILANLNRAVELVQSFMQVAIDQSSKTKRSFPLKAYLEEVLVNLHPKLKRTKINVKIVCDDHIVLDSYPGMISQIVTNLVMNSLIHAYDPNDNGTILFVISQQHERLIFEFSDDGKGIPPEHISKIFDPFFTTKRGQGGSGLGLHIVFNIVTQNLQGTIACESQVGVGTKFVIQFPICLRSI
ncbi:hybrid sensor histidine kinase/response regulator [Tumidithrix elongata RA019]|uniref:histidine kinase n=1 Tax=Tumidithrix elongata BACA0141 TaxID=2716417 RepID=A0AAW9Q9Q0_9CYAN|nr:hybrid sensor histidine kinase/response regulator [Tumidithrix elongata RA019]